MIIDIIVNVCNIYSSVNWIYQFKTLQLRAPLFRQLPSCYLGSSAAWYTGCRWDVAASRGAAYAADQWWGGTECRWDVASSGGVCSRYQILGSLYRARSGLSLLVTGLTVSCYRSGLSLLVTGLTVARHCSLYWVVSVHQHIRSTSSLISAVTALLV